MCIQGPNRPRPTAAGSERALRTNISARQRGTRLSSLVGASYKQGRSEGEQKAGVCKVASSCHHWHLSNEVTTLGTGTISKVDITLKKC